MQCRMAKLLFAVLCWITLIQQSALASPIYEGECEAIQGFEAGKTYTYQYEGKIVTDQIGPGNDNAFSIKCDEVNVFVYARCSARLTLESCSLLTADAPDLLTTQASKYSRKFSHKLHRSNLYFHFNGAEVKRVLHHPQEKDFAINIKKSILSHLVARTHEEYDVKYATRSSNSGELVTAGEWGTDEYTFHTADLTTSVPTNVQIRIPGISTTPLNSAIKQGIDWMSKWSFRRGPSLVPESEVCQIRMLRDRLVESLTCSESHKLIDNLSRHSSQKSIITLKLVATTANTRALSTREKNTMTRLYVESTIAFSEGVLDESSAMMNENFNPTKTILKAATSDLDTATPLITRLELWMVNQDASDLTSAWSDVENMASFDDLAKAKELWNTLLFNCVDEKWCQSAAECKKRSGCHNTLAGIIQRSYGEEREHLLVRVSQVQHPSGQLISSLLHTSYDEKSMNWYVAIEKLINNHLNSQFVRRNLNMIHRAKTEVFGSVNRLCGVESPDAAHLKTLEAAILSTAGFVANNEESTNDIFQVCWQNPHLNHIEANQVFLSMIKVIGTSDIMGTTSERSRLMSLLPDATYSSNVRLSAFLALITSDPSTDELSQLVQFAQTSQPSHLTSFMDDFMRTQVNLINSRKSSLSTSALEHLQTVYNVEPLVREDYSYSIPLRLTTIDVDVKASFVVITEGDGILPKLLEVHLEVPQLGTNLLDLELHLGGIQPYLDKLFGSDGAFPLDLLEALRNRPMQSWIKSWFEEDPSLSQNIKRRIQSVKQELNFFKLMNELSSTPFLSVKIFGAESNGGLLENLFNLEAGQIFHLLENLEKGATIDALLYETPVIARFATFTSIGLPKVVTMEMSAAMKSGMSFLVDITNLFFTSFSDNHLTFNPKIEVSMLAEQYVNAYRGVSSGAGQLITVSSQFESKINVKTTPSSVLVTVVPGTEDVLLLFKEEQTGLPWSSDTGLGERTEFPACRSSSASIETYWISECEYMRSARKLYGYVAYRPNIKLVVLAQKKEYLDEQQDYSYGVDLVAYMQDAQTGQQLVQIHPAIIYHPNKSMLQLDVSINNAATLTLKLGFDHSLDEATPGEFDEITISLNASTFFGDTPLAVGKLKKIAIDDAEFAYNISLLSVTGPPYQVAGEVRKYSDSEYMLSLAALYSGTNMGSLSYVSENLQINDKMGKHVSAKITSYPNEYIFFTRALHTEGFNEYEKVLHLGYTQRSTYYYFDGRMDKNIPDKTDPSKYNWDAIISLNSVQGRWNVDAVSNDHVDITAKIGWSSSTDDLFNNARRLGNLETLTMEDLPVDQDGRDLLIGGLVRFTVEDAYVPSLAMPSVVISQKPDCSPCVKAALVDPFGYVAAEITVNDDGRFITADFSGFNEEYEVKVDREEKSILFIIPNNGSPQKIKLTHGSNTGDVMISQQTEVNNYVITRSIEFIDTNPTAAFVHPLGVKTEQSISEPSGAMCLQYSLVCDPLTHLACGANEDCNSLCDNFGTCCTEKSSCLPECADYSNCIEQTSKTWMEGKLSYLQYGELLLPLRPSFTSRFDTYITYIQAKTIYFMLSHIEDVQSSAFTNRADGFGVDDIKVELRSIFENIYFGELWLADTASNPARIANQVYDGLAQLYNSDFEWNTLTPHQGAAFITQENGQFVTMNGHYHNIPSIASSSCAWLASTDTVEGAVNVLMKRDSTIYTIGEESVEITMDGRAFWSPDGQADFQQVDFPFFFKVVTCSKPSVNVIECKGMYSNARFVYYPNTGVTTIYGDMRGAVRDIQGAMGFPMNTTEISRLQLPDGTVAVNEDEFLNAYELSGDPQCLYSERKTAVEVSAGESDVCVEAFSPFMEFVSVGLLSTAKLNSYVKACALTATTQTDTCHYTDMLAFSLRKRGIPCSSDPKCLTCGSISPVRASINNINVAFVVSLSESSSDIDPVHTIENIMTSIDLKWKGDVTYSIITYGGQGFRYEPYMMTFNYRETATDKQTAMTSLENLLFDGPTYHASSSVEAIKYASEAFHDIHQGTSRTVVVVAPQESEPSVGSISSLDPQMMAGTMTNVFLVSKIHNDETSESSTALKFFEGTGGNCYYYDQVDQLTDEITDNIGSIYRSTVECSCAMTSLSTGAITSSCNRVN